MIDSPAAHRHGAKELQQRHARERAYWAIQAGANAEIASRPVDLQPITSPHRRPWHSYWALYDRLLAQPVDGQQVLVVGCGYGDDAIRLALLGGRIRAFDLCPRTIEIARRRAWQCHGVEFETEVAAAEAMPYSSGVFDLTVVNVVLHHCLVPLALAEIARVSKPGGRILMREPYMHGALQKVRGTGFVRNLVGPRESSDDERPLDQHDMRRIRHALPNARTMFFHGASGRIVSEGRPRIAAAERRLYRIAPPCGTALAAAVLVEAGRRS